MRKGWLDPRLAFVTAMSASVSLALLRSWPALLMGWLVGLVLLSFRRTRWGVVWSRLWRLELLLGVFFLLLPLSWQTGRIIWDIDQVEIPAKIFVRANAIFCFVMAFVEPLGVGGLLRAMQGIGMPAPLVQISTLSIRYLGLMQTELRQMRLAMVSRGYQHRWSRESYQAWAMILGMLFLRSLDRAENLRRSMAARSFGSTLRIESDPLSFTDYAWAVVGIVLMIVLIWLEVQNLSAK
ncbi:energy-coupling factor transporter transmembrane protein EcfT [bacterium]|nr:energy-coupling factor transporter transmembrane protein EcfT [bacterium]